jgi:hypothetical protein
MLVLTVTDRDGVLIDSIEVSEEDFLEAQRSSLAAKALLESIKL